MIGPFLFTESTVTGTSYLHMLENYATPQIPGGFLLKQNGTPPHVPVEFKATSICIFQTGNQKNWAY